ncbi:AraC family transcriptional regulator [Dyella sp.]|uniref:AraC family transcriptional regulator n=1 Tax=Dyella sp. TaxID=1869338 RepID=UPI002ED54029
MRAGFTSHAFERHSHDCFSVAVTTFGVQSFRSRGRRHDSRPGDFVLFNPDEDHDGHGGTPEGFSYLIWYIPESFVRSCIDAAAGIDRLPYFATSSVRDKDMAAMFTALTQEISSYPGESLRTESQLRHFMRAMILRHGERAWVSRASDANLARLQAVKDYIRAYFQQDITVSELASIAGLSRAHLTRAFTAAFHVPPHVYLNAVRITHAKSLIARDMPLASVAAECGYADQSHFTRRFKGSVGIAPADWRRMRHRKIISVA